MSFFINDAMAASANASTTNDGGIGSIIFLVAFVLIFYLILIRPQTKRAKEQRNLIANLAKGDEVITSGGILGKVASIGDNFIMLAVSDGVEIKIQKAAVVSLVPKGTMNVA